LFPVSAQPISVIHSFALASRRFFMTPRIRFSFLPRSFAFFA
jgi:hypothetical protein